MTILPLVPFVHSLDLKLNVIGLRTLINLLYDCNLAQAGSGCDIYTSQPPPNFESQPTYEFQSFAHPYPFNPQHPSYSFTQSQFPSHQPSQSSNSQDPTKQNKRNARVLQKERNPNWTKEEDEALCLAWLCISEDASIGTNQPRKNCGIKFCEIIVIS